MMKCFITAIWAAVLLSASVNGSSGLRNTYNYRQALPTSGVDNPCVQVSHCGEPATLIHTIQGQGKASVLIGTSHTVEAVVVGDFQGRGGLGGFFLQEEHADQDTSPATSEGIFVFVGNADVAVSRGDIVRVTGTVFENDNMTQLRNVSQLNVCSTGALLSTSTLQLPVSSIADLESVEAMAVVLPQTLTVTENYNLGRYGELTLSANGRLLNPTQVANPGVQAQSVQAANDLNRLLLNDGRRVKPPQIIDYPAPELGVNNTLRLGDEISRLQGVVNFAFGHYRIEPTITPNVVAANRRALAIDLPGLGSVKVASFNVLNYFNGDGRGGGFPTSRGADTASEFERQRAKIISALLTLDADIVGLVELENDGYGPRSAIQDLVNGLNQADANYAFVNPGVSTIGNDAIAVGIIYKRGTVALVNGAAILDANVDSTFIDSKNRPVLAQSFRELVGGGMLTVALSHLKSKGSNCNTLNDPDLGDGQGNCNLTRTAAAKSLVNWLATDPTNSNDKDFLIIGDLNAYAKEDPIKAIEKGGYINLVNRFLGDKSYSYVFRGQAGYLDHALASKSLQAQVTGLLQWHINADEPRVLDYNEESKSVLQKITLYNTEPFRSSDHDPVVIELLLTR